MNLYIIILNLKPKTSLEQTYKGDKGTAQMSEWKYGELDDKDVLARIEGHFIQPLLSAPAHTIKATTKTLELVGSRSNMEVKRIKQLTKSIVDAEEREKTYGISFIF